MNTLGRISEHYREPTVFHLLFVGAEDRYAASLVDEAKSLVGFGNTAFRAQAAVDPADPLWAANPNECLVVVVDLRNVHSQAELGKRLNGFQLTQFKSPNIVCFG